jgi:regulator of sigma E protease
MVSIQSFMQGISVFLSFLAMLSIAVGIVNWLPIPGLDGGSMVYTLIEKLRGEPISVAMELLLHRLVQIVFFILIVQLVLNDIARWLLITPQ